VIYFKAWYRKAGESRSLDLEYPEWVVYAMDEDQARTMVMESIGRTEPERGYQVHLTPFGDEDEGTVAFARARQDGQALM